MAVHCVTLGVGFSGMESGITIDYCNHILQDIQQHTRHNFNRIRKITRTNFINRGNHTSVHNIVANVMLQVVAVTISSDITCPKVQWIITMVTEYDITSLVFLCTLP